MKAFIYELSKDGKPMLGSEHAMVTNEYKTIHNLIRYAVNPFIKKHRGDCQVLVYFNWDNRYGKEDKKLIFKKES